MTIEWRPGMTIVVRKGFLTNEGSVFFKGDVVLVNHVVGKDKQMPAVVSISSLPENGEVRIFLAQGLNNCL